MSTWGVFNSAINTIFAADTYIIFLYMGLWVISILAAAFLESEVLNLPLTIFAGVIVIFVSMIISNAAHTILRSAIYSTVIMHFGQTQFLLANLGSFSALFVLVYALVIIARPTFSGNAPSGGGGTIVSY